MQMSEVVDGPCSQKFRQRHHSQRGMASSPAQVVLLQIQRLQRSKVFLSQTGEIVQELFQRFVLTIFFLRKAVKGIEWPSFAVLQNDPHPRHPVGALPNDQVAYDVECAPSIFSFVAARSEVWHPA